MYKKIRCYISQLSLKAPLHAQIITKFDVDAYP